MAFMKQLCHAVIKNTKSKQHVHGKGKSPCTHICACLHYKFEFLVGMAGSILGADAEAELSLGRHGGPTGMHASYKG